MAKRSRFPFPAERARLEAMRNAVWAMGQTVTVPDQAFRFTGPESGDLLETMRAAREISHVA